LPEILTISFRIVVASCFPSCRVGSLSYSLTSITFFQTQSKYSSLAWVPAQCFQESHHWRARLSQQFQETQAVLVSLTRITSLSHTRLSMAELPYDVWLHIVSFLKHEEVWRLLSVNRTLFSIAMDDHYKTTSIGFPRYGIWPKRPQLQ
jgi:hypothetical protein